MNVITDLQHLQEPIAATIGNFDGVHIGHQALISLLSEAAVAENLPSAVITFEPSPQEYFLGSNAPARLTRLQEKLALLENTDIDYVIVLPFDQQLADMSADDFVKKLLVQQLQVRYLLIGDDFHFGKNRLGNLALLQSLSDELGFKVKPMPTERLHDERVSSTRIRFALEAGDLATAEPLLGRPYSMLGRVAHGDKRGRTIGFPTANVFLQRHRSPVLGVYAVKVYGLANDPIYGVANVGNRPTVDGTRSLLEIHLFDFNTDIYDQEIQVEFCHKIRDEKRYDSFELLEQQIDRDVMAAKKYFAI
jgi:riboflavin kinase/FMN adenylyltransferase